MIPVEYFFVLSALLFFIGVFGFITRRNLIAMLISVELILNSVDINFAAFNRLLFPGQMEGFFFTLFSIGVSAAETAVAVAIIINVYRNFHSDQVNCIENMKISVLWIMVMYFNTLIAGSDIHSSRFGGYEDVTQGCRTYRNLLYSYCYSILLLHSF